MLGLLMDSITSKEFASKQPLYQRRTESMFFSFHSHTGSKCIVCTLSAVSAFRLMTPATLAHGVERIG